MKTIYWHELSGGRCISIDETTDANYARDCFDGSDREWEEITEESAIGDLDQPSGTFYIVSSGLRGCYMRDNVSVYGCRKDALRAAKDEETEEES